MNKNDNVLRKWWFIFVITPIFSISFSFIPGWSDSDERLLSWMVLIFIAFGCEMYILFAHKIKYRMMHYVFILSSFMTTIFVTFIFSKFVDLNIKWEWVKNIVLMIISVVVLFVIKTIIWILMSFEHRKLIGKDSTIDDLRTRIDQLEDENKRLRNRLDPTEEETGVKTLTSPFNNKFGYKFKSKIKNIFKKKNK